MPSSAVCMLISACLALWGQANAPAAQPQAAQSATVSGKVLRADSRAPVADAAVVISSQQRAGPSLQTLTDSSGAFKLSGVPPGRYSLSASKPGYPSGGTMSGRGTNSRTLTLAATETIENLEILLYRGSAIAGRVATADGEPVVRATVQALRLLTLSRQPFAWTIGQSVTTDDQGRYRLSDVPQGRYVVRVTPAERLLPGLPVAGGSGSAPPPSSQVITYYPGVASLELAQQVVLSADYEAAGCDVVMQTSRVFSVRGVAPGASQTAPDRPLIVTLESTAGIGIVSKWVTASREGKFEITGVPAGRYTVRASVRDVDLKQTLWLTTVDLVDQDIADLVLPLIPAIDVHGRVVTDPESPKSVDAAVQRNVTVSLNPANTASLPLPRDGSWTEGNEFVVRSVFSGTKYDVLVRNLTRQYYTSAVSYGETDALRENITLAPGVTLEVRLKKGAATLSVRVKDKQGKSFAHAYALLVREGDPPDGVWRWQEGIAADQHGTAEFANLMPGRYRLYAFDRFDTALRVEDVVLQRFDGGATRLELVEGEIHHSEPEVIRFSP